MTPDPNPSAWQPFTGVYEQEYYDVRTTDSAEHLDCYPVDGYFHARNHDVIPAEDITHLRLTDEAPRPARRPPGPAAR